MSPLDFARHPLLWTGITIPEFVRWYVFQEPARIMHTYVRYLRTFLEIFAFTFLLKTLFSPWKQIRDTYNTHKGFNLSEFGQTLTLNILSRTIGFLFRIVALAFGFIIVLTLTLAFAVYYMAWLTFPILFWFGITYLLSAFI